MNFLNSFFQMGPIPAGQITGSYDLRLVLLSYIVATFASYIALDVTGRLRDIGNTKLITTLWVTGGAIAMGAGIWSMHFIGMLAFSIPGMAMMFDPFWTGLSMLVAIFASWFAFFILKSQVITKANLILGGIVLGIAIASMHYVGMQAMKLMADIRFLPGLFFLSILIAILASEAALYLAIKSNQVIPSIRVRLKILSAFLMGAAICGMHYTGMFAAVFFPLDTHHPMSSIDPEILAITIAGVTFVLLGIAVVASTYKEAQNQRLIMKARQSGMAEIASNVLHNVGNVLNSVNISATLISEKITKSKLSELQTLNNLFESHANDLAQFLNSEKGNHLPQYIKLLSDQWEIEKKNLVAEVENLMKNVEHIRDIISVQQNLTSVTAVEQVVSIENALNEAIFITGIEISYQEIKIEKHYKKIKPVLLDNIKLMQILVNLIKNAKDALIEGKNPDKILYISCHLNENKKIIIVIADNAMGIKKEDIDKIFSYGFTTKKMGHGFGLHSCAIAAKDMGGTLKVSSKGLGKGAEFTLELPYHLTK